MIKDETAQSLLIEYILILSIALLFMAGVYSSIDEMMEDASRESMIEQYNDIGNDISGTMNDMYLSGLKNGSATRKIKIPVLVGEEDYRIKCNVTDPFGRQAIEISASYTDAVSYISLNNITRNVDVTGMAYSGTGEVTIRFNSNSSEKKIELS